AAARARGRAPRRPGGGPAGRPAPARPARCARRARTSPDEVDGDLLLDDLLAGPGFGQRSGLLGPGRLGLHLRLVLRLADVPLLLRLGDEGQVLVLPLLGLAQRGRRADRRLPGGRGLPDGRVALDLGRPLLAERLDVPFLVLDL